MCMSWNSTRAGRSFRGFIWSASPHRHTPTCAHTHTAEGWFIKLLLLILNNPETFTPHLPCCCFRLIHELHVYRSTCAHSHVHFSVHAHTHICICTHGLALGLTEQGGLGAIFFAAKVENWENEGKEEGGGQAGGRCVCVCVPVHVYKSHSLVKGTIHHRLLGRGCGQRLFNGNFIWMMTCFFNN